MKLRYLTPRIFFSIMNYDKSDIKQQSTLSTISSRIKLIFDYIVCWKLPMNLVYILTNSKGPLFLKPIKRLEDNK